MTAEYGVVDLKQILNTSRFNMKEAAASPGWLQSLISDTPAASESDKYGVTSFVYWARKPFHTGRLRKWIEDYFLLADKWNQDQIGNVKKRYKAMTRLFGNILRSKGFCWITGHDTITGG